MDNEVIVKSRGQDVRLSPDIVRRYLVQGQGNVTDQEMAMFLGLCKYQGLNPFLREVYLIKYGSAPASIVVGKEAFLKRAQSIDACKGYRAGVIAVLDGREIRTDGYLPAGAELVGGWAEISIAGWQIPFMLSVSLSEYDTGKSIWGTKSATMIRKVALVQALREAFPDTFGGMYSQEELPVGADLPTIPITVTIQENEKENGQNGSNRSDNGPVGHTDSRGAGRRSGSGPTHGSHGGIAPGRKAPDVGGMHGQDPGPGAPENDRSGAAPGAEPAPPAGNTGADPGVVPVGRRRRQRFDIPEPMQPQFRGGTQIHTCGVSPEQLVAIRERMADPSFKTAVTAKLAEIGHKELGFLRADEAEALLAEPSTNAPTDDALPDDLVECPTTGDSMSAGMYCLAGKCQDRNRTGYCPAVDVLPPVDAAPVQGPPEGPPATGVPDAPMLQLAALVDRQDRSYQRSEDPGVVARGSKIQHQIERIYRRLEPEEKRRADEMIRRHRV